MTDKIGLADLVDSLDDAITGLQVKYEVRRRMLQGASMSTGFLRSLLNRLGQWLVNAGYGIRRQGNTFVTRPRSDEELAAMLEYLERLVRTPSQRWVFELHGDPPNPDAKSARYRDWVWDSLGPLLRPTQEEIKPENASMLMRRAALDNPLDALAVLRASGAWSATVVLLWALGVPADSDYEIAYRDLRLALRPECDDVAVIKSLFRGLPLGASLAGESADHRWTTFPPLHVWPNEPSAYRQPGGASADDACLESSDG